jgi:hypothetical protein
MSIGHAESKSIVARLLAATNAAETDAIFAELAERTGVARAVLEEILGPEEDEDYLIERITLFEAGSLQRDRTQLVALVQKLIDAEGSRAETNEWLRVIEANVPAPLGYVTDLIFQADTEPRAEDVVAQALAYRALVPPR